MNRSPLTIRSSGRSPTPGCWIGLDSTERWASEATSLSVFCRKRSRWNRQTFLYYCWTESTAGITWLSRFWALSDCWLRWRTRWIEVDWSRGFECWSSRSSRWQELWCCLSYQRQICRPLHSAIYFELAVGHVVEFFVRPDCVENTVDAADWCEAVGGFLKWK